MSETTIPNVGRNEPCPCGSGKKYKRCHGQEVTAPTPAVTAAAPAAGGFDPSQVSPEMMQQMTKMLQRLPKSQMQRIQSLMQKAMQGKDIAREAAELERMLPPDFQAFAQVLQSQLPAMMAQNQQAAAPMSEDEAKRIVQEAVASGKMSAEEAAKVLGEPVANVAVSEKKKFWPFSKKS